MAFFQKNKKVFSNRDIVAKEKNENSDNNPEIDFSNKVFGNKQDTDTTTPNKANENNMEIITDAQNKKKFVKRNLVDSIDEIQPNNAIMKPLPVKNGFDDIYDLSCIDKIYGKDINVFPEGVNDTETLIKFLQNELNKEKPLPEINSEMEKETEKTDGKKETADVDENKETKEVSKERERDIFDLIDDDFNDF